MGKFLTDVNLNQNEIQNVVIQNLNTDPIVSTTGQIYYNDTIDKLRLKTPVAWVTVTSGTITIPTLQDVVNSGNGISNFGGIGNASIQSTNFTNNRTLYLNDNAYPTIRLVDNLNASNNLQIDLDTLTLDGVSYNWSTIVNPPASPLSALPFTTDHLVITNNQYVIGDLVWYLGNVYRCIANNDSIIPTSTLYWTNLGIGYPLVQQPSDWSSTSGNNQILNKPAIPSITPASLTKTDDTNVTLTLGGSPSIALLTATSLTLGWTGTLADSRITSASYWNAKQPAGNYITSLTGEATALGPDAASVTLSNPAVTSKVLTGVNVTGGTILATDTILIGFGKLQNQINGLIGGSIYQGTWNASTNTPILTSSVGIAGYYYIVSISGSTNLNGITDWQLGDWAIFNGGVWQKVDNTDAVSSVNGQTGAVSLTTDNISEGITNLYFTNIRSRNSLSFIAGSGNYDNTTGVITIPTNNNQIINGAGYITSSALTGYVSTSRTISTTSPLQGGGDLTADRTLSILQSNTTQAGFLSSTDWNTFNGKQNTLTNPITGTGTTNYVSKFTGTTSLGNSLIYDDGTNVSIGNTTGLGLFNVAGTKTAASAIARGTQLTPTLVASANNDVLVGLDIALTFTNGAFANLANYAIRHTGDIVPSITNSYTLGGQSLPYATIYTRIIRDLSQISYRSDNQGWFNNVNTQTAKLFSTGNFTLQNGGTFTDVASSRLTVNSTTQGFLPPRMTTAQKNVIVTPATGLIVYDTDLLSLYQYNGTAWVAVGSGGGSSKSINSVSTNTVAGSTASTDYFYFASGTINITLPTAVGNNNNYVIKNVGTGTITIDTTSSQTIDGSLTAPIKVQYLSLTLISDGANWNII